MPSGTKVSYRLIHDLPRRYRPAHAGSTLPGQRPPGLKSTGVNRGHSFGRTLVGAPNFLVLHSGRRTRPAFRLSKARLTNVQSGFRAMTTSIAWGLPNARLSNSTCPESRIFQSQ